MFPCSFTSTESVCAITCLGTKLCMTYFPTHLKLTPFTPAWQHAPVHVVVNNSHWPSAPLTFTCYKLIMTTSVVCLINLCETQNLKDYYDDFRLLHSHPLYFASLLLLWRQTWPSLLLCIVKNNLYSGNDWGHFYGRGVKDILELFLGNKCKKEKRQSLIFRRRSLR